MIIRRIEISNFKKLTGPVVLDGIGEHITVIAGDNEAGKSTVLQALRAAFFQRHNATGNSVNSFQPYNSHVRPQVAVEFEINSDRFRLEKAFCLKKYALLRTPRGVIEGPQVEEELQEICRSGGTGKSKASSENEAAGIWGLLWIDQASTIKGLSMKEGGKRTLLSALEAELGTMLSGSSGTQLLQRIQNRFLELFSELRKEPRGEYRAAKERLKQEATQLQSLQELHDQYNQRLEQLALKQEHLARLKREKVLERLEAEWKGSEKQLQQYQTAKREFEKCLEESTAQQLMLDTLREKWKRRQDLLDSQRNIEQELLTLASKEPELSAALIQKERSLREAEADHALAEATLKRAENDCEANEQLEQAARLLNEQREKLAKKELAERLEAEALTLQQEIKSIIVDEKALQTLRGLQQAVVSAESKLAAASTKIEIRPREGRQAFMDGAPIFSGKPLQVTSETIIELEGWGSIAISPGGENLAARQRSLQQAEQEMKKALSVSGVTTIQEGEEKFARKQALFSKSELLRKEAKMHAPAGAKAIALDLSALERKLNEFSTPVKSAAVTPEQATERLSQSRFERQACSEQEKISRNALTQAVSEHLELKSSLEQIATLQGQLYKRQDEITARLAQDQKDKIEHAVVEEEHKLSLCKAKAEYAQLNLAKLKPDELQSSVEGCRERCEAVRKQIGALSAEIHTLTEVLQSQGHAGLGEQLQDAEIRVAQAEEQFNRIEREALSIKLLYETLKEAESQAREQFMEPVSNRMKPYLDLVLPGTSILIDKEEMEIRALQRAHALETFADLSIGTREQLSVLTRLAFAELLKDMNYPAAVILDDALVYSDESRHKRMEEAIKKAAQSVQIIILTCRERDYRDLGAPIIRLHETN